MPLISRATEADLPEVQRFIDEHWLKGHVLARSLDLLKWQYGDPASDDYNLVLARGEQGLLGILGYVPSRRFERDDLANPTVWLALWQVREDIRIPGLGLLLWRFIADREKPALFATLGINETTLPLYKRLGYETGELDHHLILNPDKTEFKILSSIPGLRALSIASSLSDPDFVVRELVDDTAWASFRRQFTWKQPPGVAPRKTLSYFENRYFAHPFYRYSLFGISSTDGSSVGLVVLRKVEGLGGCALRIIDALGPDDIWQALAHAAPSLLQAVGAQYLDLLSHGIPLDTLRAAGFIDRRSHPEWVVPNHFEPFSQATKVVRYAAKSGAGLRYVAFKGDGDQDRPNLL